MVQAKVREGSPGEQSIVNDAVDEWQKRLQACVNETGGHSKYLL